MLDYLCLFLLAFLTNYQVEGQNKEGGCQNRLGEYGNCANMKSYNETTTNYPNFEDFLRSKKIKRSKVQRSKMKRTFFSKKPNDKYKLFLDPPKCGVSSNMDFPRIVGGRKALLGTWPWMAVLGYIPEGDLDVSWVCGGALINNRFILTAAHCAEYDLIVVRLGDLDTDDDVDDGATPVDYSIEKKIKHEKYNNKTYINDIALLKLNKKVTYTDLIKPICLPKLPAMLNNDFSNYNAFAAGWGTIFHLGPWMSHLLEVQLPIVKNDYCKEKYKPHNISITKQHICTAFPSGGKDVCQGDSGGPLMVPKGMYFYVIGVVSFGYSCGEADSPGVYARVSKFVDWIHANLNK